MLDPNTQEQTTQAAAPGAEPEAEDILTMEQLLEGVIKGRGDKPVAAENEDPERVAMREETYMSRLDRSIRNEIDALMEVNDNISRNDAHRLVLAAASGDVVPFFQACEKVIRKLTEQEQNEEDSENLRVEPANSGSAGESSTEITGVGDAVQSILSKIRNPRTA